MELGSLRNSEFCLGDFIQLSSMEIFHFERFEMEKHPNRGEVRIEMCKVKACNKRKLENAGRKFSFQVLSLWEAVSSSTARSDTPKLANRVMPLWRTEGREQEKITDSSQECCFECFIY